MDEIYTGYKELQLTNEQLAAFYSNDFSVIDELKENEYLVLLDEDGNILEDTLYQYKNGFLRKVNYLTLGSENNEIIKPKNVNQKLAFDMMKDEDTPVKLITGKWGTGKTMILCAAAIEAIDRGRFDKIVWVRNNVQVKDTDALGALPGTELDKVLPYVMPFADHCGGIEGVRRLIDEGTLEVVPLGFLRGRSIRNSIIISSEAENLTKEHIQLLLGRVDEGSNLWLDADLKQRDRAVFEKSQGIETMIERLAGNKLFGYVHLIKSERSAASRLADLLD